LTGKTANYGFHLDDCRKSQILVDIKCSLKNEADFGALGHAIGEKVKSKVLFIAGIKKASSDELKAFCASTATYGATALFHIENMTPEWKTAGKPKEKIEITEKDLKKSYDLLDDGCDPDFISVGCPHCSLEELGSIAAMLRGKMVKKEFWVSICRDIGDSDKAESYVKAIEKTGAKVVCDTCMAVAPLKGRFRCLATNSAKACFYGRGSNDFKVKLCSLEECVKYAVK
jgi:predicted aconitase